MKFIQFWVALLAATILFGAVPAYAQKCDGPAELCAQVLDLQQKLAAQKTLDLQDKTAAVQQEAKAAQERTMLRAAKLASIAAIIAVVLKTLLSMLAGWKDYFQTDKGKAWLRLITLIVGFVAFVATNIGFGIPWWQALVVAVGGPGAILVHEVTKIVPALRGQGLLPPSIPPPAAV